MRCLGCGVGEEGDAGEKNRLLLNTRMMQVPASSVHLTVPNCVLRVQKQDLLPRLWLAFWLDQMEGPISLWGASTCFSLGGRKERDVVLGLSGWSGHV